MRHHDSRSVVKHAYRGVIEREHFEWSEMELMRLLNIAHGRFLPRLCRHLRCPPPNGICIDQSEGRSTCARGLVDRCQARFREVNETFLVRHEPFATLNKCRDENSSFSIDLVG